jgi:hypothetical protein
VGASVGTATVGVPVGDSVSITGEARAFIGNWRPCR